jgi:hypothetical protein
LRRIPVPEAEALPYSTLSPKLLSIDPAVDRRDLLHPLPPVRMLQFQDLVVGPMKVVRDKGYLLVKLVEGIA